VTVNNELKIASKLIDSLLLVQNSSTARARSRSADSTAAVARTRREQQLENFTQRESSQFERIEAHLQQQTEQELKQTLARDKGRSRSRDRGRDRELDQDKELGREDEESEESKALTESLFEHQQKASNDEGFYEMFRLIVESSFDINLLTRLEYSIPTF